MLAKVAQFVCLLAAFAVGGCVQRPFLHPSPNHISNLTNKLVVRTRIVVECDDGMQNPSRELVDIIRDLKNAEILYSELGISFNVIEITNTSKQQSYEAYFKNDSGNSETYLSIYYLKNKMIVGNESMVGLANFPWDTKSRGIAMVSSCDGWTLAHEIGHYFGLRHTFDLDEQISDTLSPEEYSKIHPSVDYYCYPNIMNYRYHNILPTVTPQQLRVMNRYAYGERAGIIDWKKSVKIE